MEKLIKVLKDSPINDYKIKVVHSESAELFYVLNKLETSRATNIEEYEVTIYIDREDKRGSATFSYYPYMSEDELRKEIEKRIYAASFALNPYYEIPSKNDAKLEENASNLKDFTLNEAAEKVARAILKCNLGEGETFSATEIFITKKTRRILNSRGVDLSETTYQGFIELIPGYEKDGEEVETYNSFKFSNLVEEEITSKVKECMELTKARFNAKPLKLEKPCKVIIEGEDVANYFEFFSYNLNYSQKFQHINRFEVGQSMQGDNITGDKLNISLISNYKGCSDSTSFDGDGVVLHPVTLVKDGIVQNLHGPYNFGYYLKVENPTGVLPILKVEPGSKSVEDMKKEPYVRCVKFSSFQLDDDSGFFGGEVRLGFYYDGEKEIPVTGFSIAGNLYEVKGKVNFSKEITVESNYIGPKYIEVKDMSIN